MSRTRSNYNATERFRSRLFEAHQNARIFRQTCDQLIAARGAIFVDAREAGRTRAELAYLEGHGRALWDAMWNRDLQWRLGYADIATATALWDYKTGLPTHGAHFWKDTDRPFTTWEALDRGPSLPAALPRYPESQS